METITRNAIDLQTKSIIESGACKYGVNDGKLLITKESIHFRNNARVVDAGCSDVDILLQDIILLTSFESEGIHVTTSREEKYLFLEVERRDDVLNAIRDVGGESTAFLQQSDDEAWNENDEESQDEKKNDEEDTSVRVFQKKVDLEIGWSELKTNTDPLFQYSPIESLTLPCTLDTFQELFWCKNAKHPISTYQRDTIGDTDINTFDWEQQHCGDDDDEITTLSREIHYLHPNHAPRGPPMAKTTKKQTLKKYGGYGMVLHTITKVDDVPKADCFVIEDQIVVESNGDSVILSARCGIRFVKRTIFKTIIQFNAKNGITKWLGGYGDFVSDVVNDCG